LAIHRRSSRRDGPFVAINCSAIPETLLESELFGHEKGAFTGAHVLRKGRIENANGGTLFLDEIAEIPQSLQVKLLRFLQQQRIERVGGRQEIQIDTRVIAATNADLKKSLAEGKFREDLYYRLAVVQIALPPLKDRRKDIRLLAQSFLIRSSAEIGKTGLAFDGEALRAMTTYSWPGNVRELENRVRRAVVMAEGKRLTIQDLELTGSAEAAHTNTLKEARETLERGMIRQVLQKHSWKIAPAAVELGVSRPTMYELMEKLGIAKE
jgi:two-component system NtrC family response regulator